MVTETSGGSLEKERGPSGVDTGVQVPPSAQSDKANELFAQLNTLIHPNKLAWVNPQADCVLLEKNAHYMSKEMLDRLTENVKNDKFLSQIPFAVKKKDEFKFVIISGNHRVKAAVKAKLDRVLVMYIDEDETSKDKALAIQLSHNAIRGEDDKDILLELYKELSDLDMKAYTGLIESEIMANDYKQLGAINEELFDYTEVRFMFTPATKDNLDKILAKLEERTFASEEDRLVLLPFEDFAEIMTKVKARCNIKNNTTAFLKMIDICKKELEKPQESTKKD